MAKIGIYIHPDEFAEFRKLAPNDPQFAATYLEWHRLHSAAPRQVTVRPHEFSTYCMQIGQEPSFQALAALAALKAREEER